MSLPNFPRQVRRVLTVAFCFAAAALASGCSGSSKEGPGMLVCPDVSVAPNLIAMPQFGPGPGRTPADVIVGGKITGAKGVCSRDEKGIVISAVVQIYATRVSLNIKQTSLPYFVAVADSTRHILAKETFRLDVQFLPGENYRVYNDKVTVHLPVNSVRAGGDYIILVGFQLSPEQLEFNRSHNL